MNDWGFRTVDRRSAIAAALLAAASPPLAGASAPAPAPARQAGPLAGGTVRGVPGKTGEMPGPDVESITAERWRATLDRGRWSEPVAAAGAVYASRSGVGPGTGASAGVSAIDLASGAGIWRGGSGPALGFDAAPCVADGRVAVGGGRWTLLALAAATGAELWRYVREVAFPDAMPTQAAGQMTTLYGLQFAAPTAADGLILAGGWAASGDASNPPTAAKGLYAVDAASGALRWNFPVASGVMASPAAADGAAFVAGLDGVIYAVGLADGAPRWSVSGLAVPEAQPAAANGLVYVPTRSEGSAAVPGVVALDAATGDTVWRRALSGSPVAAPAVAGGLVIVASANRKLVVAVDAMTGEDRWNLDIGAAAFPAVFVPGGLVYVATAAGTLHAIDPAAGAERWRHVAARPFASPPLVAGGSVIITDNAGGLSALW